MIREGREEDGWLGVPPHCLHFLLAQDARNDTGISRYSTDLLMQQLKAT